MGSDRIITLDIGARQLVMAEFASSKDADLELVNYGFAQLDLEPDDDVNRAEHITAEIKNLMQEHGIKGGQVLVSISGQAVFPRYVKLPPVTKDKIAQMVGYEAEQNVPFPIEEVVWDYQLIGGDEGELNVMLVAAKTDIVKLFTDCVEESGMEPELVDVAPMALYNTVRYNYAHLEGCTMVLDIGARSSNLIFIEGNKIFTRSIPVAGNSITQELMKEFEIGFTDAEELKLNHAFVSFGGVYAGPDSEVADRVSKTVRGIVTRLHAEVNRSINFYRSQHGGSAPERVLLTGGTSVIPHLDTFFNDRLGVEVDYLNPFSVVTVSADLPAETVGEEMHLLGEVVGLALRRVLACPIEINLMPPHLVAKKTFRRRQPFFAMATLGLILTILCWWGFFFRTSSMSEARLKKLQDEVDMLLVKQRKLTKLEKQRLALEVKVEKLVSVVSDRTRIQEIVSDLHSMLKPGMWITSVKPHRVLLRGQEERKKNVLAIEGLAFADKTKADDIGDAWIAELKKLRYFSEKVNIDKKGPFAGGEYATEFRILAELKPTVQKLADENAESAKKPGMPKKP